MKLKLLSRANSTVILSDHFLQPSASNALQFAVNMLQFEIRSNNRKQIANHPEQNFPPRLTVAFRSKSEKG